MAGVDSVVPGAGAASDQLQHVVPEAGAASDLALPSELSGVCKYGSELLRCPPPADDLPLPSELPASCNELLRCPPLSDAESVALLGPEPIAIDLYNGPLVAARPCRVLTSVPKAVHKKQADQIRLAALKELAATLCTEGENRANAKEDHMLELTTSGCSQLSPLEEIAMLENENRSKELNRILCSDSSCPEDRSCRNRPAT